MELHAKSLGLAGGIFWGIGLFILTWLSYWFGYASMMMDLMADVYPGYEVSPMGSFIGLAWGFIDGFVGLYIFAWLYNKIRPHA